MEKPLVSVIVPVLNEENTIGHCLESLLAQDFPQNQMEWSTIIRPIARELSFNRIPYTISSSRFEIGLVHETELCRKRAVAFLRLLMEIVSQNQIG